MRTTTPREHLVTFKVSADERAMIEQLARQNGDTMSQAIRRLVRRELQGQQASTQPQGVGS